jgi:hypothetical protein
LYTKLKKLLHRAKKIKLKAMVKQIVSCLGLTYIYEYTCFGKIRFINFIELE